MNKHTEGPWAVDSKYVFRVYVTHDIFFSPTWLGQIPNEQMAANVHLIAAAPDLLEALIAAEAAINPQDKSGISMHVWNERLKAATTIMNDAIAKAKGESDE